MPFNQSTYQHDFKPPLFSKFIALPNTTPTGEWCTCLREKYDEYSCEKPPYQSGKIQLNITKSETVVRRINCENTSVNRILYTLKNCYPKLFEKVQNLSEEELRDFLNKSRMETIYQIDYCKNKNRFVSKSDEIHLPLNIDKLKIREEALKLIKSKRSKPIKEINIPRLPKTDILRSSVKEKSCSGGHITEYMDGISKIGCKIMKNNIHLHSKCLPKMCNHDIDNEVCRFKNGWQ